MKTMKKALAFVLTLAIVMSLGITAFADPAAPAPDPKPYKIILQNNTDSSNASIAGRTFTAVRVMTVSYEGQPGAPAHGDKTKYGYKLDPAFANLSYVKPTGGNALTEDELIEYLKGLGNDADGLNHFTRAAAKYYNDHKSDVEPLGFVTDAKAAAQVGDTKNEKVTLEFKDPGYFVVIGDAKDGNETEESTYVNVACALQTTNPTVTLDVKVAAPKLEKKSGSADIVSAEIGENVPFTLTTKVPNMTGYDSYQMVFTDTLSAGLTINKDSFKVTIGGEEVTPQVQGEGAALTSGVVLTYDGQKFTLKFFDLKDLIANDSDETPVAQPHQMAVGEEISVSYTAKVNEKAMATKKVENNTAYLEYTRDPAVATNYGKTPNQIVDVYNFGLDVSKFYDTGVKDETTDEPDDTKLEYLKDASFVLVQKARGENDKFYHWNDSAKDVEWLEGQDNGDVRKTVEGGKLDKAFVGLKDGTYYLRETKQPDGYTLLTEDVEIKIEATKDIVAGKVTGATVTYSYGDNTGSVSVLLNNGANEDTAAVVAPIPVENKAGTLLPSTGGIGTTIFYTAGAILMVSALVLLITKKKMSAN